jgi:diaminopimelate epimerase
MKKINFHKIVASGNDFVVARIQAPTAKLSALAKSVCERRLGVGADGLLVLEPSSAADIRMRVFNADGSEAEMCGNGARCVALHLSKKNSTIETKAGIVAASVQTDTVRVRLTDPRDVRLDVPIIINGQKLHVNSINTGVPHAVIFVADLKDIDVAGLGCGIRYHDAFQPAGTNVNFVQVTGRGSIALRTYERGVEAETLACGTGATAAALIFTLKNKSKSMKVSVSTRSREILTVYFNRHNKAFSNVWLEGKARVVFSGTLSE